jgi:hypothetical protein
VTNLRFPVSGEREILAKVETLRDMIWPRPIEANDSILFVNVEYDKEQRPTKDLMQMPAGRIPITDRGKLIRLLSYLKEQDSYRYILLDVSFSDDIQTEYDSELYGLICSMPRIVIPMHSGVRLADNRLLEKAGLADYETTYFKSSFLKYPYFNDTVKSVPIRMYEEVTGRDIKKTGIFYSDGGRLARSSIVLTFELLANRTYADDGDKIWYNLGMDLLNDSIAEFGVRGENLLYEDPDLTRDKYIVIGSFGGDDMHSTFAGTLSGSVILFNAFISLMNEHHVISMTLLCVLFVVFFFMSYLTLSKTGMKELLQERHHAYNNRFSRILLGMLIRLSSWIGYSMLLTILCLVTYFTLGEAYDIFITSTAFYLLSRLIAFIEKTKRRLTK